MLSAGISQVGFGANAAIVAVIASNPVDAAILVASNKVDSSIFQALVKLSSSVEVKWKDTSQQVQWYIVRLRENTKPHPAKIK